MKKFFISMVLLFSICSIFCFSSCSNANDTNSLYEAQILELEQRIEELENTSLQEDILELKQKISSMEESSVTSSDIEKIIAELERIESKLYYEYNTVKLTTANYAQYLAINITYSDCIAHFRGEDSLGIAHYDLSCIVTITTSAATNCKFEYAGKSVSIFYNQPNISGWSTGATGATANIDYNGNSSVSFAIWKNGSTDLGFPTLHEYDISIESIYGNALVPQEA